MPFISPRCVRILSDYLSTPLFLSLRVDMKPKGPVRSWFTAKLGKVFRFRRRRQQADTNVVIGGDSNLPATTATVAATASENPDSNPITEPPTKPLDVDNTPSVGRQDQVPSRQIQTNTSPSSTPYLIPPVKISETLPLTTEEILSQCPRYAFPISCCMRGTTAGRLSSLGSVFWLSAR